MPWVVYLIFAALGHRRHRERREHHRRPGRPVQLGVTLPVCAFFAAAFGWAWVKWQQSGTAGMAVFAAALFGGLVGFSGV